MKKANLKILIIPVVLIFMFILPSAVYADDHGSWCDSATSVGLNSSTSGEITFDYDADFFKVILTEAGTLTAKTTGGTNTWGQLRASDCSTVLTQDTARSSDGTNFLISETLSAGTYYITTGHMSWPSGRGSYTMVVSFVSSTPQFSISPTSLTVTLGTPGTATLSNGTPSYTAASDSPSDATASAADDGTLTVTGVSSGTATITVTDNNGDSVTLPVTVVSDLSVSPSSMSFEGYQETDTATVSSGTSPYSVSSSNSSVASATIIGSTVTVTSESEGSATITITDDVGDTVTISVTVEFADDFAGAIEVDCGSQFDVTINDNGNDEDFFKIYIGGAGTLNVYYTGVASHFEVSTSLYNSSENHIDSDEDGNFSRNITTPGYYYLRVYDYWDNDTDTFTMQIDCPVWTPVINPDTLTVQMNNTATTSVSGGTGAGTYSMSTSNASIATATVSGGTITVTGVAKGSATITVTDGNGDTDTCAVTVISDLSVAPTSMSLGPGYSDTATVSGGTSPYSVSSNATSVATTSISDTTVTVNAQGEGSATITVTDDVGDSVTISVTIDHGDTCGTNNTQVNCGSTTAGSIDQVGDHDYYKINHPGGRLKLYSEGGTDVRGYLFNSSCNAVDDDDDSGAGLNFEIDLNPLATGTYYLRVQHWNNSNTGPYTLKVECDALAVDPETMNIMATDTSTATISGNTGPYTISSSDENVATAIESGGTVTVTGVASGNATITITDSVTNSVTIAVSVYDALAVNPTSLELNPNTTPTGTATVTGGLASYTVSSGDVSIATATISGDTVTVTAVAEGNTVITVTDSASHSVTISVTVYETIVVNPTTLNIMEGFSKTSTRVGGTAPFSTPTSDDTGVATVSYSDPTITVTGESAGTATISITDDVPDTATISVNVYPPLAVSPTNLTIYQGDSSTATVSGGLSPYSVSSSNDSVASATISGTVVTVTAGATQGTATITVTDSDSNTATIAITVPALLSVSPTTMNISPGDTPDAIISGGIAPFTVDSSAISVATVSISDRAVTVTGVAEGDSTITVTDSSSHTRTISVSVEHGDNCNDGTVIGPNSTTYGNIDPNGDNDYFEVTVASSGVIKIYTEGGTDTYGYLYNSVGSLLERDDDDGASRNFYIEENIDAGTYCIRIRHYYSNRRGNYDLKVEFTGDDYGNTIASSTTVECGDILTDATIYPAGDLDYFKIVLDADTKLKVYTNGTTNTYGYLYDSSENIIDQDDDGYPGDTDNFLMENDLTAGTYYIAVRHYYDDVENEDYDLYFECGTQYIITTSAGSGGSISPSGDVSVQEGQNQTFAITPSAGNSINQVKVDGAVVLVGGGPPSSYEFTNISANHTITATFNLPPGECVDISDTPLDARFQAGTPNIMFVLDDSGSMDWEFFTDQSSAVFYVGSTGYRYVFDNPGDNLYTRILPRGSNGRLRYKSQWSGYNKIYYDPEVDYEPWPDYATIEGLADDDADPDTPRSHPMSSSHTFNLSSSYDSVSTDTIIIDNEDSGFSMTPELIRKTIDNKDNGFSSTASGDGEWKSSDLSDYAYGGDFLYGDTDGIYTATWATTLAAGQYEVYAQWNEAAGRPTVPYSINHDSGVSTINLDQTQNGGKFYLLGTYSFDGASSVSLSYTRSGSGNPSADAVDFYPVENTQWDWSTSSEANDSVYYYTEKLGDYTATWTPNLPSGTYKVYARWAADTSRAAVIPYTVTYSGGATDTVNVDQTQNGGQWILLGTYAFNGDPTENVSVAHTYDLNTGTFCADAVKFVATTTTTLHINRAHYFTWDDNANTGVVDPGEIWLVNIGDKDGSGAIAYHQFTDSDSDDIIDAGELSLEIDVANVPASVITGRTYAGERQNFANWYQFHRRRELTATASIANVISAMQGVNIGFYSINGNLVQPVLPVSVGGSDDTSVLLENLYSLVLRAQGTPLRRGLQAVGKYFHQDDGSTGGIGESPFVSEAEGGECQQTFAIVMTDGYWNGSSPYLGNVDSNNGTPYADNYSDTLADVAMYYYENDLSSGLDDLLSPNEADSATHQHMVTYTVSFGVFGTLNPDDYDFDNSVYPTWPNPGGSVTSEKIDDMWHAAVNGRGTFLSASNTPELVSALLSVMQNIESRIGSASSVSVNGDELYEKLGDDIRMFQASYSSDGWSGDVKAYEVDADTGEVDITTYAWSAADQLELLNWDTDRKIITFNNTSGVAFRVENLTDEQKIFLTNDWDTSGVTNIVNFIRGDRANEDVYFRNRTQMLGDIVHSSPLHKDNVLYAGGNDGMLHAFAATDDDTLGVVGGEELFAYVPDLVYRNLKNIADPDYSHTYYVDLTPTAATVNLASGVTTMLVGGLGKGGQGIYALDISNPYPASETEAASMVMWEYPPKGDPPTNFTHIDGIGSELVFSQYMQTFSFQWWDDYLGTNPTTVDNLLAEANIQGDEDEERECVVGFGSRIYNGETPVDESIITVTGTGVADWHNDAGYFIITAVGNNAYVEFPKWPMSSQPFSCDFNNGGPSTLTVTIGDPDLGYTYSRPALVESNDPSYPWVVIFGNGYSSFNGHSVLYVLDASDGSVIRKIDTGAGSCNGLSTPIAIDVPVESGVTNFDNKVDFVYAGDLNGNLWKFDLTSTDSADWGVAYGTDGDSNGRIDGDDTNDDPKPLFVAKDLNGDTQPITTKPEVMFHCAEDFGYMITFGTGRYLGEGDFDDTQTQTIYGIWDYGDDAADDEYIGEFDRLSTPQLSNQPDAVKMLQQSIVSCTASGVTTACDGDFWVVNDQNIRITTDYEANWETIDDLDTGQYPNPGSTCCDGVDNDNDSMVDEADECDTQGFCCDQEDNDGDNPEVIDEAEECITHVGWYLDLPISGERVVSDLLIRDGKVVVIAYTPEQTPCGSGGNSVVMEIDACTGTRLDDPVLDINEDGVVDDDDLVNIGTENDPIWVAPSGIESPGRLLPPAILRVDEEEIKYFSSSRGTIETVTEKAVSLGMTYWKEFE